MSQIRFRDRPGETAHRLAPLEADHGRDALDAELGGQPLIGIDIDLGEFETARLLGCETLEKRAQHPARTAPGGPEIDDHRQLVAAVDHFLLEGRGVDILDEGRVRHLHLSFDRGYRGYRHTSIRCAECPGAAA